MKATDDDLRAAWQSAKRRPRAAASRCPSSQALAEAATGGLTRRERQSLADHVADCSECAEEIRLVPGLREWATEAAGGRPPTRVVRPRSALHMMAAGLAVAAVGLFGWALFERGRQRQLVAEVEQLQTQLRRPEVPAAVESPRAAEPRAAGKASVEPQINVPVIDLLPDAERGSAAGPSAEVGNEVPAVALILGLGRSSHDAYALELIDTAGKLLWEGEGLRPGRDGALTVMLPRALLGSGARRFRLYGLLGTRRELVHEYRLRVVTPPPR